MCAYLPYFWTLFDFLRDKLNDGSGFTRARRAMDQCQLFPPQGEFNCFLLAVVQVFIDKTDTSILFLSSFQLGIDELMRNTELALAKEKIVQNGERTRVLNIVNSTKNRTINSSSSSWHSSVEKSYFFSLL